MRRLLSCAVVLSISAMGCGGAVGSASAGDEISAQASTQRTEPVTGSSQPPPTASPNPASPTDGVVCTSGELWGFGNSGSSLMRPGVACISCHASGDGPTFQAAGTVYPTFHEPDDCVGVSRGLVVELTDASGAIQRVSVNGGGNFFLQGLVPLAMPYRARVIALDGTSRSMSTPQQSADCNSCHTQNGLNGAPGRITAP